MSDGLNQQQQPQQFCLRWHNYQNSLLSSLPQLLDWDDLTDVTLYAGGCSIKAHRIVLSACSQYFKSIFKELQPMQHPVIVVPGADFTDLSALVTFMYNGEVNIYQHQLPSLIALADTLDIKGLAQFTSRKYEEDRSWNDGSIERWPTTTLATARHKRSRPSSEQDTNGNVEKAGIIPSPNKSMYVKKCTTRPRLRTGSPLYSSTATATLHHKPAAVLPLQEQVFKQQAAATPTPPSAIIEAEDLTKKDQRSTLTPSPAAAASPFLATLNLKEESLDGGGGGSSSSGGINKTSTSSSSSSKLYATCAVCGKQLSNQYNLRVHMETHRNAHYACSSCSHVSRSRDALRKHVSYRHPPHAAHSTSTTSVLHHHHHHQQQQQQQNQQQHQPQPPPPPPPPAAAASEETSTTTTSSPINIPQSNYF